MNRPSIVIDRG